MSECLGCHKDTAEYQFSAIEIQTLHIRDVKGERYVQAMGDEREFRICGDCAMKQLESVSHPIKSNKKVLCIFFLLATAGLAATLLLKSEEAFVNLLGPLAVCIGIIGMCVTLRKAFQIRKRYQAMDEREAKREAAWEAALAKAPKKYHESDLTYVPVNSETGNMNEKQLQNTFDLLSPIAKQVHQKLKEKKYA